MTDSGMSQDASDKGQQVGSAGGDVKQMKIGDVLDLAAQLGVGDIDALNNLIGDIQAEVDAGNVNVGDDDAAG